VHGQLIGSYDSNWRRLVLWSQKSLKSDGKNSMHGRIGTETHLTGGMISGPCLDDEAEG